MTRMLACCFVLAGLLVTPLRAGSPEEQIKAVLETQVATWNKGDLVDFVSTYADDCVFVGKEVARGKQQLLARYRKAYPNTAAMGTLSFSDLDVKPLDASVAIATARWHLERGSTGGGPIGGVFSLVFRKRGGSWKIVLDHTS